MILIITSSGQSSDCETGSILPGDNRDLAGRQAGEAGTRKTAGKTGRPNDTVSTSYAPEEWRPVVGYEGLYEVSDMGRVRLVRGGKCKIKRTPSNARGYLVAKLNRSGSPFVQYVHRLVGEAFLPNPLAMPQVNHIDGDKSNNSVGNLEWVTSPENMRHARRTGLLKSKLSSDDVAEIRSLLTRGEKQVDIAARYSISQAMVSKISVGKNWASLTSAPTLSESGAAR